MWQVEVLGETFREGDLSLADAERIEELSGKSWHLIHPGNSAKMARRIVAVMYASRHEVSYEEAVGKLDGVSMTEFINAVGTYDDMPNEYVDGFPQAAAEPSTDT